MMRTGDLQVGSHYTNLRLNKCRQIMLIRDGFNIIYREFFLTVNDIGGNYWSEGECSGRTFATWADRLSTQKEITHCANSKGNITTLKIYESPRVDTFGTWLLKQVSRHDDVGEYARAWQQIVMRERGPRHQPSTNYFREHFIGSNLVKMVREAMDFELHHLVPGIRAAWHEFVDFVIERDCRPK